MIELFDWRAASVTLCSMSCRVTPKVVCGAVKIQRTSSVSASPSKTTPRRLNSALVSSRSSTSIPKWADDRSLAILELWHAEARSADLNQL